MCNKTKCGLEIPSELERGEGHVRLSTCAANSLLLSSPRGIIKNHPVIVCINSY
jgi:hypothetical protein